MITTSPAKNALRLSTLLPLMPDMRRNESFSFIVRAGEFSDNKVEVKVTAGDFDGNSVRMNTIVNYVSEMSKELKTFLDSPMPKERWKQRKPMYQKKVKKELKLHPLLAGFTGKQKC